jgi:hypothetical protein
MLALPVLLCLVPLATTLAAWSSGRRLTPPLGRFRNALFRGGLIISILSSIVTISCWIDPYPLASTPDGSYSIAWLELAWEVAFGTAFLSIILAFFGRSRPRMMLIVSGTLLLLLTFGSLLQNGV